MKYLTTLLILFISSNLICQVKLIEKSKVELIGEISKEYIPGNFYKAHLKKKKKNERTYYEIMFKNIDNESNFKNETCYAEFSANKNELNLIYETIWNDFSNPEDAKTKFKIGKNELKAESSLLHLDINSRQNQNEKNEAILAISINECTIYINRNEWKKLFGK